MSIYSLTSRNEYETKILIPENVDDFFFLKMSIKY